MLHLLILVLRVVLLLLRLILPSKLNLGLLLLLLVFVFCLQFPLYGHPLIGQFLQHYLLPHPNPAPGCTPGTHTAPPSPPLTFPAPRHEQTCTDLPTAGRCWPTPHSTAAVAILPAAPHTSPSSCCASSPGAFARLAPGHPRFSCPYIPGTVLDRSS